MFFFFSQALAGECGFMAANLYARSIFGEDALANVSIEKPSDQSGPSVTGHVRIRAKSQVIGLLHVTLSLPHGDYLSLDISRRRRLEKEF